MKHVRILARELRLERARKFGERCGRLLYYCPCAAELIQRYGLTEYELRAFRTRFGDTKRARGELVVMACDHSRLSACLAVGNEGGTR